MHNYTDTDIHTHAQLTYDAWRIRACDWRTQAELTWARKSVRMCACACLVSVFAQRKTNMNVWLKYIDAKERWVCMATVHMLCITTVMVDLRTWLLTRVFFQACTQWFMHECTITRTPRTRTHFKFQEWSFSSTTPWRMNELCKRENRWMPSKKILSR